MSLSEQELIDCDKGVDQGCEDGEMEEAFEFVICNHGITSEAIYPYKGNDGTCGGFPSSYDYRLRDSTCK